MAEDNIDIRKGVEEAKATATPPRANTGRTVRPAPQKQAKYDPHVQTADSKPQTIRHFADGFYELNKGLAMAANDPYYEVTGEEADSWATAFYNTLERYDLLDKVAGNVGPFMLAVITFRIVARDIVHYFNVKDNKDDLDEDYDAPPPIVRVGM